MNSWRAWRVAWGLLALLVVAPGCGAQVSTGLAEAQALIEAGQLPQANLLLGDLARQHPDQAEVFERLGRVELRQQLWADALQSFKEAQALGSKTAADGTVEAAEQLALADRRIGLDDEALLVLMRARKQVPDSPRLLLDFAMQAESLRIFVDAEKALVRAHELAPADLRILYGLARVEMDEQKLPAAEEHLRAYVAARPDDATAHYGLGHLLHMAGRNDDAAQELRRSLVLQPRQTSSMYELGEMALEAGDDAAAGQMFAAVLALAPEHGGALAGRGRIEYRAKDYAAAERDLRAAVRVAPEYGEAHHFLGLTLIRLGQREEGEREAAQARMLNEKEVHERRGNFLTVSE